MSKSYKWTLRKGSRKDVCPQCGQKRFVRYVLAVDGTTEAGEQYGRCDRETSCGYHMYPKAEQVTTDNVIQPQRHTEMPITFQKKWAQGWSTSALTRYAETLIGYERTVRAWDRYHVHSLSDDSTVFYQIDYHGTVRAGKVIRYSLNGHRIKDAAPVRWLHKMRGFEDRFVGTELHQCLFGEHLLADVKDTDVLVYIVESEKTAVMMSEMMPCTSEGIEIVWLASGGAGNIKSDTRCKILEGYDVVLMPDEGMYASWRDIANKRGWQISAQMENYNNGADILDIFEQTWKLKNSNR